MADGTLDCGNAGWFGASTHLAKETLEVVLFEPIGGGLETLNADGGGDTSAGGTGTVGVEVLMHF